MQSDLFDDLPPSPGALPDGLAYAPGFLSAEEEASLIALVRELPLQAAQYKSYVARRRVVSYGGRFDYGSVHPTAMGRVVADEAASKAQSGAGLGTRRAFATPHATSSATTRREGPPPGATPRYVTGPHASAGGVPRLDWPLAAGLRDLSPLSEQTHSNELLPTGPLVAAPRSVYALRGAARWAWQHSVAPVDALRWSITFRTARRRA